MEGEKFFFFPGPRDPSLLLYINFLPRVHLAFGPSFHQSRTHIGTFIFVRLFERVNWTFHYRIHRHFRPWLGRFWPPFSVFCSPATPHRAYVWKERNFFFPGSTDPLLITIHKFSTSGSPRIRALFPSKSSHIATFICDRLFEAQIRPDSLLFSVTPTFIFNRLLRTKIDQF